MVFDIKVGPTSKTVDWLFDNNGRPMSGRLNQMVFGKKLMPLSDGNANKVSDNFSVGS